jgi:hypothetical protein
MALNTWKTWQLAQSPAQQAILPPDASEALAPARA